MEPVEINAGAWYLRALRSDERVDDRPALLDAGIEDPGHVARRTKQWADDTHYSWAVCEPSTGELLGEIGVTPLSETTGRLTGLARPGYDDALETGKNAVRRFAEGALGLTL